MTVEQINKQEETEIDLIEVIRKLWAKRKFILKVTVVFMALGVLIALFSPKEYTAGCTMVPQIGEKTTGGNLSGLAAMAGAIVVVMYSCPMFTPKYCPACLSRRN
jgi:LPS O-antigen subunit length determinant protein (WzzB/FepE family)